MVQTRPVKAVGLKLYVGDETVKSVTGVTETEIKNFRMARDVSHGMTFTRIYFIGETYVDGGIGTLKVSIDAAASVTVWQIAVPAYALYGGYIDVAWADNSIHVISVRLVNNTAGKITYNRTLEVYI